MPGNESVPHWFRRAVSLLQQDISVGGGRTGSGVARAREAAEQRRREARRAAELSAAGHGSRELKAIVQSWEEQQAAKARATAARKGRLRR